MQDYLSVFKALGEPTRLRIMNILMREPDPGLCVCEIVAALQENQYNISRHLQFLAKAGLVTGRKQGRWIYYRIKEMLDPCRRTLVQSIESIPAEIFQDDFNRLYQRLALRINGECVVGCGKEQNYFP